MAIPIQIRGGTTTEWAAANPVIPERMLCAEKLTDGSWKFKIGDGVKTWSDLPYFTQGVKGDPGPANTLTLGTVTTGAAGSQASATITGTAPNQTLNLTIPRGDQGIQGIQGLTGPANVLSIGTVSSGTTPSATITGSAPAQTLNLVLPKGDQGIQGPQGATGPGVPNGGATGQLLRKTSSADQATAWGYASVAELSDAVITSPATDQVLQYSSGKWRNQTLDVSSITPGTTPPSSPKPGAGWLNTNDGTLFVWYQDGNSGQWIESRKAIADDTNITGRLVSLEAAPAGLVRIIPTSVSVSSGSASVSATGLISLSSATDVRIQGVFSSAFRHYRIVADLGTAGAPANPHQVRFIQPSGTPDSSAGYTYTNLYQQGGVTGAGAAAGSNQTVGSYGYAQMFTLEVFSPFLNSYTMSQFNGIYAHTFFLGQCGFNGVTSFSGINFLNNTLTGTIQVYGYRN